MSPYKLKRLIERALSSGEIEKATSLLRKFEAEHPGSSMLGEVRALFSHARSESQPGATRRKSVRSHYDNLKVSREAPIEVIRAAYKALAQKYHPDRNPGDEQAVKVMQIINDAYKTLSDEESRREHDRWVASHEG